MNEVGYHLVRLGYGADYSRECIEQGYIAVDHEVGDISDLIAGGESVEAKEKIKDLYCESFSEEPSKGSVSVQCGNLFRFCWTINKDDLVVSPTDDGEFAIGRISGDYYFDDNGDGWPHRRKIEWLDTNVGRDQMTPPLVESTKNRQTITSLSEHIDAIEALVSREPDESQPRVNQVTFALENQLEDFLVDNWDSCELGRDYEIYEEDGILVGQQYATDEVGNIDILAVSKDGSEYLVVELKKGRTSDKVIGQLQRYMGYMMKQAEADGKTVRGCIVAREDDKNLRYALKATSNIDFYCYKVSFELEKIASA